MNHEQHLKSIGQHIGRAMASESFINAHLEVEQAKLTNSELGLPGALMDYAAAGDMLFLYYTHAELVAGIIRDGYRISLDADVVGQPLKVEMVN